MTFEDIFDKDISAEDSEFSTGRSSDFYDAVYEAAKEKVVFLKVERLPEVKGKTMKNPVNNVHTALTRRNDAAENPDKGKYTVVVPKMNKSGTRIRVELRPKAPTS